MVSAASPVAGVLFNVGAGLVFLVMGLTSERVRLIAILGLLFLVNGLFSAYRYWIRKDPNDGKDNA